MTSFPMHLRCSRTLPRKRSQHALRRQQPRSESNAQPRLTSFWSTTDD